MLDMQRARGGCQRPDTPNTVFSSDPHPKIFTTSPNSAVIWGPVIHSEYGEKGISYVNHNRWQELWSHCSMNPWWDLDGITRSDLLKDMHMHPNSHHPCLGILSTRRPSHVQAPSLSLAFFIIHQSHGIELLTSKNVMAYPSYCSKFELKVDTQSNA